MKEQNTKSVGIPWLKELGFTASSIPMDGEISTWWGWYRSQGDFYAFSEVDEAGNTFKVERISFSPAKMVCEDWASVLFTDHTSIGVTGVCDLKEGQEPEATLAAANEWLQGWIESVNLVSNSITIERCFGLGTAAWVLELNDVAVTGVKDERTSVGLRSYDARRIVPLSFDGQRCTECAFTQNVTVEGKVYTQWVVHRLGEDKTYEIHTAHFKANGQRVYLDGFSETVRTGIKAPLFALIRPAIDNTYWEFSPFGASIFDAALGCVKLADGSFDNTWKDIFLGQKILFVPEEMLRIDEDGNYTVPRARDQQLFLKTPTSRVGQSDQKVDDYNPDLRVSDNRMAIDTALSLLGKRVGFGFKYYSLDDAGGLKTAKEVASDNAELMRNAKKHQKIIGAALKDICEGAAALAGRFCDVGLADLTDKVTVLFDDTIVQDDDTERERMRADVAAGLVPAWKYVEKYYGVDEATAKAWAGWEEPGSDGAVAEIAGVPLNGAQTASFLEIYDRYKDGKYTKEETIEVLAITLKISSEQAERLFRSKTAASKAAKVMPEVL